MMPAMAVQAVIFDWGGTLTPWHTVDLGGLWQTVCAEHYAGARAAQVAAAVHAAELELWQLANTEQRSSTLSHVFERAGVTPDEALLVSYSRAWEPHTYTDPDAPALLGYLRERGIKVGVLSNTFWPRDWHEEIFRRDGVLGLIDGAVYTSEIDWVKPHQEAFRAVMAAIGEPLGVGVVASLARPGGNVTGLSAYVTELAGKRVELMKEARPSIARIGFLLNMGNPVSPPQWDANQASAKALGLSAELFDIRTAQDISGAFATIAKGRVDALSVGIDALTQANAKMIVDLAAEHGLLTAYPAREFVEFGGLLSYGPSYPDLYYRAAGLIDKIFKGAKPGDLPVEQPTKLELVINLKTAKTLGLEIPPNLLARADEVID